MGLLCLTVTILKLALGVCVKQEALLVWATVWTVGCGAACLGVALSLPFLCDLSVPVSSTKISVIIVPIA